MCHISEEKIQFEHWWLRNGCERLVLWAIQLITSISHPWHQAITSTDVDLSFVSYCDIHLRAVLKAVLKLLFFIMVLKIIFLKSLPHLPGASELKVDHLLMDITAGYLLQGSVEIIASMFIASQSSLIDRSSHTLKIALGIIALNFGNWCTVLNILTTWVIL